MPPIQQVPKHHGTHPVIMEPAENYAVTMLVHGSQTETEISVLSVVHRVVLGSLTVLRHTKGFVIVEGIVVP